MLEYVEAEPLPARCEGCEEDCGSCDYTFDRWHLTPESEQELQKLIEQQKEKRKQRLKERSENHDTGI